MDIIRSKEIFLLTRETLKLLDSRLMKHGSRVAYILYKMLMVRGRYAEFEMAEYAMLATLHDIGAYTTSDLSKPLSFETRDTFPHSIYGYLFMKHLSPFEDRARILLNHHISFMELAEMGEKDYIDITTYLALAECVDIYRETLGDSFKLHSFRAFEGKKFSKEALDVMDEAEDRYYVFDRLNADDHDWELSDLMDNIMFTNEEKKRYLEMIMFCLGFRSPMKVRDTATCISLCTQLAEVMNLDSHTQEQLYYGALLHDIGMLAIPKDVIESDRKLTDEEFELMRSHVTVIGKMLESRIDKGTLDIALRHHERFNGSGYPGGLKGSQMSVAERILQIADTVTGMINDRPYRPGMPNEKVRELLTADMADRMYDPEIMKAFFARFDEILSVARKQGKDSLLPNIRVDAKYEKLKKAMELMHKK